MNSEIVKKSPTPRKNLLTLFGELINALESVEMIDECASVLEIRLFKLKFDGLKVLGSKISRKDIEENAHLFDRGIQGAQLSGKLPKNLSTIDIRVRDGRFEEATPATVAINRSDARSLPQV